MVLANIVVVDLGRYPVETSLCGKTLFPLISSFPSSQGVIRLNRSGNNKAGLLRMLWKDEVCTGRAGANQLDVLLASRCTL